jgi:hypothetical protein
MKDSVDKVNAINKTEYLRFHIGCRGPDISGFDCSRILPVEGRETQEMRAISWIIYLYIEILYYFIREM